LLAIPDRYVVNRGARSPFGIVVAFNAGTSMASAYRVPNYDLEMQAAYTHKTAMAPYRAAGRPPAVYAIEHALDQVARELGLDPAEVRARNFIQPNQFPYALGLKDRH